MQIRLDWLETFVLVARLKSMKAAAEVLSLSAGAISQRIRALEERAGYRLFQRQGGGIALTHEAELLLSDLAPAFETINRAWARIDGAEALARQRLTVSTMPSFANFVLVPRLGSFSQHFPQVEVNVETDLRVVDLHTEPVDIAIRHGLGDYPGLVATPLISPSLIVVGSLDLIAKHGPLKRAADCLALPLLHDHTRQDWRLWFEAHGVATPDRLKGPAFSDGTLIVRAAVAGQGLGLVREFYAAEELESGRLIRALDVSWPSRFGYYLVATAEALQRPVVRAFRNWLVEEMATLEREAEKAA
ncbi:MAG: LysR family transcriptional regulator [Proteobacteria bacterium]|nr:LysR family transcriptional regulator [Pseudomonadota bacterium]